MDIPPVGWRVPYVIVYGEPGRPLIHSVRKPQEVLYESHEKISGHGYSSITSVEISLRPNASYYILKVIIPVLSRCFSLIGVDVMAWYAEMPRLGQQFYPPRLNQQTMQNALPRGRKNIKQQTLQGVIPQYFLKKGCRGCETTIVANSNEGPLCLSLIHI